MFMRRCLYHERNIARGIGVTHLYCVALQSICSRVHLLLKYGAGDEKTCAYLSQTQKIAYLDMEICEPNRNFFNKVEQILHNITCIVRCYSYICMYVCGNYFLSVYSRIYI